MQEGPSLAEEPRRRYESRSGPDICSLRKGLGKDHRQSWKKLGRKDNTSARKKNKDQVTLTVKRTYAETEGKAKRARNLLKQAQKLRIQTRGEGESCLRKLLRTSKVNGRRRNFARGRRGHRAAIKVSVAQFAPPTAINPID